MDLIAQNRYALIGSGLKGSCGTTELRRVRHLQGRASGVTSDGKYCQKPWRGRVRLMRLNFTFLTKTMDKNPNFSIFLSFRFYSLQSIFFQNIVKHIFWAYLAKNKNMATFDIFDQNHGLTPLKKSHFSIFFNFSSFFFQSIFCF